MKVKFAVLADYANTSTDGKLNIMGIFSRIQSTNFPARHPQCHVVVSCTVNEFDRGQDYPYTIRLHDEDGNNLLTLQSTIHVPSDQLRDINLNFRINELVIPAPGNYEFLVQIDKLKPIPIPFFAQIASAPPGHPD